MTLDGSIFVVTTTPVELNQELVVGCIATKPFHAMSMMWCFQVILQIIFFDFDLLKKQPIRK